MNKNIVRKQNLLKKNLNLPNYDSFYTKFSWDKAKSEVDWFDDNKINAGYNALDVPAKQIPNKTALIWFNENNIRKTFTFLQLLETSNQFANYLLECGVNKGDRVFFFLPKVPLLYCGFLATIRLGAIAGTLFPAFNSQALLERLANSEAKILITNKELSSRIQNIKDKLPNLKTVLIVEEVEKEILKYSNKFTVCKTDGTDPCFMLYTSATGNTPTSGVVIPHQAILQQKLTAKWVLDLKENDIYWCTSDPGWVTGVVYGILAPWSLGITQIIFDGRFGKIWGEILEKERVTVFYTAPTALRMLREAVNPKDYALSVRHVCTVGEALDTATLLWVQEQFGTPAHDTWWQTETGAMMVVNFPTNDIKPGSMGKPVPGIEAHIVGDKGQEIKIGKEGFLAFNPGWPSMMIKIWQNEKMYHSYFKNGWYISGDKAFKDKDGYFWFIGRADDVIKTAGERVGPFEVESCLMDHPAVAEAGVIGKPDKLRGQIIKAFVVLKKNYSPSNDLIDQLQQFVKTHLAGHAYPREIEFINKLPKNRSGKIVRRILKAKELGLDLGNTSTLED